MAEAYKDKIREVAGKLIEWVRQRGAAEPELKAIVLAAAYVLGDEYGDGDALAGYLVSGNQWIASEALRILREIGCLSDRAANALSKMGWFLVIEVPRVLKNCGAPV